MDTTQAYQDFLTRQIPHIDLANFAIDLVLTAVLTLLLGAVYSRYGAALSDRKVFARNLVIVGMTTMLIITIVKSSLALSLGLVGALSIVRFRTPIKEPEELAYLFLSIAIGLGLGAGQRAVVAIGFILIAGVIWLFKLRQSSVDDQGMLLTVSSTKPTPDVLDNIVNVLGAHASSVRLRRVDETSDLFQCDFSISFDRFEQLGDAKRALRAIDKEMQISFLDNQIA